MRTPLRKRILDSEAVRGAATVLAALYIRIVWATTRWDYDGAEIPQAFWGRGEPFVLAVWHGRLLMVAPTWPRGQCPVLALISKHRDGELIARTISRLGFEAIRGSSSRGTGANALRQVVRALKEGTSIVFTPDGPRGPRMRASEGIVSTAKLSGAAVVPFAFGASRRRHLRSWDRFLLPLPFGRGALVWGAPIRVPRDAGEAESAAALTQIEAAITAVTGRADRRTGHLPVEPAPATATASG